MKYILSVRPYHLNPLCKARILVGSMFGWRKKNSSDDENLCPYCNSPNPPKATQCSLCYYDLTLPARDQPMAEASSSDSDMMSILLSDDLEEFVEEDAVEAVLSLDEVTVEIDQFETSSIQEQEFDYLESKGPTLSETKDYQTPEEVELSKSDAPKKEVDFIVPDSNPLDEVLEPVHTGQGSLFSVASHNDFDIDEIKICSIPIPGLTNMDPLIMNDHSDDNKIDLAAEINESVEEAELSTPEIPDIPDDINQETTTPEIPDIPDDINQEITTPEIPDIPDGINQEITTPEIPEIVEKEPEVVNQQPAPIPQHNNRIWPWPAKQEWDERQVYREVVTMLELVKSGKLVQTAVALDRLGPHLNTNLEMLAHIGTIMRYLGREEHLQWMLKMAQIVYPNDERVSSAITHLS